MFMGWRVYVRRLLRLRVNVFMEQCMACPLEGSFHYETACYLDSLYSTEVRQPGDIIIGESPFKPALF